MRVCGGVHIEEPSRFGRAGDGGPNHVFVQRASVKERRASSRVEGASSAAEVGPSPSPLGSDNVRAALAAFPNSSAPTHAAFVNVVVAFSSPSPLAPRSSPPAASRDQPLRRGRAARRSVLVPGRSASARAHTRRMRAVRRDDSRDIDVAGRSRIEDGRTRHLFVFCGTVSYIYSPQGLHTCSITR